MKMKNIKELLVVAAALLIGLTAGYFLFGQERSSGAGNEAHSHDITAGDHAAEDQTWTCAMHPQIRQNEPGLCPICEMDLVPLSANTSNDPLVLEMTPEAVKLAQIETTIIGASSAEKKRLQLSGKMQVDERLAASQVAHIPGRIEQLFVTFTGERVQKGQKLATIYSPELVTAQQELVEALKLEGVNDDLVQAARKKLAFWKIPAAKIQAIEESGQIQEFFTLLADASGTVAERRVAVGDHVRQGEVLFDIVGLKKLWVVFDAFEEDLASIKVGDKIEFSTPAVPNRIFSTRINFIDPLINAQTRTTAIRGEISNVGQLLKPEMFVRGELQTQPKSGAQLLVPKTAVLWTGTRSVIYLKEPNTQVPSFRYQEISLGERVGENYQVEAGIEAGDEVVTYGSFTIDAAAQLNNQKSMMNKLINQEAPSGTTLVDYTATTPTSFKIQLSALASSYLPLKDALIATDAITAAKQVDHFTQSLAQIDAELLEGDARLHWLKQLEGFRTITQQIQESEDIDVQRQQFETLSNLLIDSIKSFGIEGAVFYIQHCPMASNNKGADWISTEEAILNPYFGDKMLKCGMVQEMIDDTYQIPALEEADL